MKLDNHQLKCCPNGHLHSVPFADCQFSQCDIMILLNYNALMIYTWFCLNICVQLRKPTVISSCLLMFRVNNPNRALNIHSQVSSLQAYNFTLHGQIRTLRTVRLEHNSFCVQIEMEGRFEKCSTQYFNLIGSCHKLC